jgi:L-amino acid N-acyltransferase YncA
MNDEFLNPRARHRPSVGFRRPTVGDVSAVTQIMDSWWNGRSMSHLFHPLWFEHFGQTSWIAENSDGSLAGFLVGFISQDHPETAYVHLVAVHPSLRKHGIATELYRRFFTDARERRARVVEAVTSADNRASLEFHEALGFRTPEPTADRPGNFRSASSAHVGHSERIRLARTTDRPAS